MKTKTRPIGKKAATSDNARLFKQATLKAVFLLGTLKAAATASRTRSLSHLLIDEFLKQGVASEIIHLSEFKIKPGTQNNMGPGDQWPKILERILAADIIIFATPIWWGSPSSLIQQALERLGTIEEALLETGVSAFFNKVGGIVMTGEEDGVQHVTGVIANFALSSGLAMPACSSVAYVEEKEDLSEHALREKMAQDKDTMEAVELMARSVAHAARIAKRNPFS